MRRGRGSGEGGSGGVLSGGLMGGVMLHCHVEAMVRGFPLLDNLLANKITVT